MNKSILYASALVSGVLFSSCEPEEIPIDTHGSGEMETGQVHLGGDYGLQIFYNLESNSVVSSNPKDFWDLGFESGENGWRIILNSALFNAVAYVDDTNFEAPVNTSSLDWSYDLSSGDPDSTAMGDYRNTTGFYVIDLGIDNNGNSRGFKRLRVLSHSASGYLLRVADLNLNTDTTFTLLKENETNYTCLSLNTYQDAGIEPMKEAWDLMFTQYTYVFHNPPVPYLVTGVLLNPNNVEVAEPEVNWSEVTFDIIPELSFTRARDVIGYDWKYFDFDSGLYLVDSSKIFVIRDTRGKYFKIRFIDFYDTGGEKGHPKFELIAL